MFFKKLLKNIDLSQPEDNTNQAPVYIIGVSPLAIFLGATLQNAGENIVIISNANNCKKLKDEGIILKEEYNLQKKLYQFNTSSSIKDEPKLIILAADPYNLKSHLTFLRGKTYPDAPLLCFNQIEHIEIIRPLLGRNFTQAYVNGYLQSDGETITVYGRPPHFTVSQPRPENETNIIYEIFSASGCKVTFNENNIQNYWEHFAPSALGFLASSVKAPLSEALKNKDKKEEIIAVATELSTLTSYCKAKLSTDEIMHQLLETPHNYCYKAGFLSKASETATLDIIYSALSNPARIYKCKLPKLNLLMKNNYNTILKK